MPTKMWEQHDSFSRNHTLPYSMIALQILNLTYEYNDLAWNSACLTVESGAIDQDGDKNTSSNYGKVAVAISNMEQVGITIAPPDINKSGYVFTPDFDGGVILFGLKGMSYVGDDLVTEIVESRPYTSYGDFYKRIKPSKRKNISLIKSNAFRNIEEKDRRELLMDYIAGKAKVKTSLSLRNMAGLFDAKFFSNTKVKNSSIMWYLRKILRSNEEIKVDDKKYFPLQEMMIEFLNVEHPELKVVYKKDKYLVESSVFESTYEKDADKLRKFIKENEKELLKEYNKIIIVEEASHYTEGTIGKWEMDSISYYATDNELDYIDYEYYPFVDKFKDLKIKPVKFYWKDKYPVFHLSTIIGTCLSRNKNKHMTQILTRSGVVTVKFKGSDFAYYDRQVKKNSSIIDSSFFSRGNKIMITGYRSSETTFRGKDYSRTKQSLVYLIEKITDDGKLEMRSEKHS